MPVSRDNCLMGTSELALLVGQTLFHFKCFISQEEIPRNCVPQQLEIKDRGPFLWWDCSLFQVFEVFTDWVLEEKLVGWSHKADYIVYCQAYSRE